MIGALTCALGVLQVKPGGTVVMEPECSTWLNTTVFHTKRDRGLRITGDEGRRDVREANFVAELVCEP